MRVIVVVSIICLSLMFFSRVFAKEDPSGVSKAQVEKQASSAKTLQESATSKNKKVLAPQKEVTQEMALPKDVQPFLCEATLFGTDQMQYVGSDGKVVARLSVSKKKCPQFKIHLKFSGKLSRNIMGHNLIIGRTKDIRQLSSEAMKATRKGNYLPAADNPLVIAQGTKLLGGGPGEPKEETLTLATKLLEVGGKYTYFCGFPGHAAMMRGELAVVE